MSTVMSSAPTSVPATPVPPAIRQRRPGWRDPRLLVGVLILAGSIAAGAKVFAAADDTTGVWAAARDLPAGATVSSGDLVRVQVRFAEDGQAARYLSADAAPPAGQVLDRAVAGQELLPRAALGRGEALVEVPLAVEVDRVPATLAPGSVVDVWVAPVAGSAAPAGRDLEAVLALDDVVVVAAPSAADGLAPSGTRQVIVGLDPEQASGLGDALGRLAVGSVVLTRQG